MMHSGEVRGQSEEESFLLCVDDEDVSIFTLLQLRGIAMKSTVTAEEERVEAVSVQVFSLRNISSLV